MPSSSKQTWSRLLNLLMIIPFVSIVLSTLPQWIWTSRGPRMGIQLIALQGNINWNYWLRYSLEVRHDQNQLTLIRCKYFYNGQLFEMSGATKRESGNFSCTVTRGNKTVTRSFDVCLMKNGIYWEKGLFIFLHCF